MLLLCGLFFSLVEHSFFAAEHIFWKCPIDICINVQDRLRFLIFHLVNILYQMPRSCGFLRKRRGLYENIVNFKLAFLGELKFYSQANLMSSQTSNSSPSTSDFSSCQRGLTAWKIRCRSTWNWEHTCKNKYVFLQQLNSIYLSLAILLLIIMVNEKQEREVSSK